MLNIAGYCASVASNWAPTQHQSWHRHTSAQAGVPHKVLPVQQANDLHRMKQYCGKAVFFFAMASAIMQVCLRI